MSMIYNESQIEGEMRLLEQIFENRLTKNNAGVSQNLSTDKRAKIVDAFGELRQRLSSLLEMNHTSDGGSSLDSILCRLMAAITSALDADRSTLFLYDQETDELFSRIVQGELIDEIRVPSASGVAGSVFTTGKSVIISDAYSDDRFNPQVDKATGYKTETILCAPVRNWDSQIIGVTEVLNSRNASFTKEDLAILEALTAHAAAALESTQLYESVKNARNDEAQLLGVTAELASELKLDVLLDKIMSTTTIVLEADRSTLFLYDVSTHELWSKVAEGTSEIRIPATAGIAGSVFSSGETINIPDAYADSRFNPAVDKATGYRTRSILCMPLVTNEGKTIGVTQVLNKVGGPFGRRDEKRLAALGAQAAIALENARLFEDVLNARNYSESILKCLSNGVITLDSSHRIIKVNSAALRLFKADESQLIDRMVEHVLSNGNEWVFESLSRVESSGLGDLTLDADIAFAEGETTSVNLNIECLYDVKEQPIGFMFVFEDITTEKRVKSTMAKYMDRELADRLLEGGELAGTVQQATVLFSDIRNFTNLSEAIGARDTVSMLNDYFSEMVEVISTCGGMLDKYIGDAIMVVFGTPFAGPDDADNAVKATIEMMQKLDILNRGRALRGLCSLDIRLGVNTGEVIAGNIGSPKRVDYTVIGDSVNLASRLEGANKFYGTSILISEYTRRELEGDYPLRELDLLRVKGRDEPVAVYQVLELEGKDRYVDVGEFSAGLELYREQVWEEAAKRFSNALNANGEDRPSRLFLDRCDYYKANPPQKDWDGVWTLTEK